MGMKNPPWHRDELILALELYLRHKPSIPAKNSSEIMELSELLNKLRLHSCSYRDERYRNPNSVHMKLRNFLRLDPAYQGSGLQRGGKAEETVWQEFANEPERCRQLAEAIRAIVSSDEALQETSNEEEVDGVEEAEEGLILTKVHRLRERSQKLVNQRKSKFLKEHGHLFCEACGFDFEQTYGEHGKGFIECHHLKPLHTLRPGEKTHIEDLALVCSNCHRMLHAKRPWLTMGELTALIRSHHTACRGMTV